jgi:hypothetical protein
VDWAGLTREWRDGSLSTISLPFIRLGNAVIFHMYRRLLESTDPHRHLFLLALPDGSISQNSSLHSHRSNISDALVSDLPSITLRPETNKWRLLTVILYYNGGKKQWENGWLSLPMIMATMEFDLKRWFWSFPSLFPRPA